MHRYPMTTLRFCILMTLLALAGGGLAVAQDVHRLPQDHDYQRGLRAYMVSLTEADFAIPAEQIEELRSWKEPAKQEAHYQATTPQTDAEYDELLRVWMLLGDYPRLDEKRAAPSLRLEPQYFTIASIEHAEGVRRPWVWAEPLTWLANWDYPTNPFRKSAPALKRRAIVAAAIDLIMIDHLQETDDTKGANRTDFVAPHIAMWAYTLRGAGDVMPAEARAAYAAGLEKACRRIMEWGPKGEETQFEMLSLVGLWYAAEAIKSPEFSQAVLAYIDRVISNPEFVDPAGYFPDAGAFDSNFSGMSLYFATWLAMASDLPAVCAPVNRAWTLRSHLLLPDPDGTITGPTHFNTRTNTTPIADGWGWPHRQRAAAMLSDEAMAMLSWPSTNGVVKELIRQPDATYALPMPTDDELRRAPGQVMGHLAARYISNEKWVIQGTKYAQPWARPWTFQVWPNSMNMEMVNYAHEHYRDGLYRRMHDVVAAEDPYFTIPLMQETPFPFINEFGSSFVIRHSTASSAAYSAVIHTGAVSGPAGRGYYEYEGPYGFGGGQLSAFWTADSGSIILGCRAGMTYGKTFDTIDGWRSWPIHAVTGVRPDGKVFSSSAIRQPTVKTDTSPDLTTVTVSGEIPKENFAQKEVLDGQVNYTRVFVLDDAGVSVTTTITADGKDQVAELIESIPIYSGGTRSKGNEKSQAIVVFLVGETEVIPADDYVDAISSIKITRFGKTSTIEFSEPQRVRLSKKITAGTNICQIIQIDLLRNSGNPVALKHATISWRIGTN